MFMKYSLCCSVMFSLDHCNFAARYKRSHQPVLTRQASMNTCAQAVKMNPLGFTRLLQLKRPVFSSDVYKAAAIYTPSNDTGQH